MTLTVFELRRMLRNPLIWAAAVLAIALEGVRAAQWWPDLTVVTLRAVTASTLVAGAVLVAANLAAGRDRRFPETLAALPGRAPSRTRAVLLAAPVVGALAAAVVIVPLVLYGHLRGPAAGSLDVWEALNGVALAALAATVGAALARWTPWPFTPLLVIFAFLALIFVNGLGEYGGWALPWIPLHDPTLGPRPSALHLLYLLLLAVAIGAVALLRHGLRLVPAAVAAVATAIAVPAIAQADYLPKPPPVACRQLDGLSFCPRAGYEPWVGRWAAALRPITSAVPPEALADMPALRQDTFGGLPQVWLTGVTEMSVAGRVATGVAGLEGGPACGKAQTVVALWLTGLVSGLEESAPADWTRPPDPIEKGPGWHEYPLTDSGRSSVSPGRLPGVVYDGADLVNARALLADPGAAVKVRANWAVLTDPATTTEQAAPLLGIAPIGGAKACGEAE
ncbi:hypothetical protein [Herbidospora yilanensis]|uniref:hypothetical protein n=1 Tax=Herbidospora yilanensis TaxID=354426 RepID=UPI00078565B7|nr:hypothetical protein [Herbidospora yilanensis]